MIKKFLPLKEYLDLLNESEIQPDADDYKEAITKRLNKGFLNLTDIPSDEFNNKLIDHQDLIIGKFQIKLYPGLDTYNLSIYEVKLKKFGTKKVEIPERVKLKNDCRFKNVEWIKHYNTTTDSLFIPSNLLITILKYLKLIDQFPEFI